jgi:predicted nucleic acid-binding protein
VNVPYVYDAGVLIAVDSNNRRMWARHHLALEEGRRIIVPAVVIGQAWRDSRRQVVLGRFLRTCEIEPTFAETAKDAGVLCGKAGTSDVIDAVVVAVALAHQAIVLTSDPHDIAKLASASEVRPGLTIRGV